MTEAGVNVTFKPTNSIYSFHRLPESGDVTRLGSVSLGYVPRNREVIPRTIFPMKFKIMAQRVASEVAASVWSAQEEEETDKLTTVRPLPIVGDEGD